MPKKKTTLTFENVREYVTRRVQSHDNGPFDSITTVDVPSDWEGEKVVVLRGGEPRKVKK